MPIVSGMGGNAGTQTMAVAVRAIATNQITSSNTIRQIVREFPHRVGEQGDFGAAYRAGDGPHLSKPGSWAGDRDGDAHQQHGGRVGRHIIPVTLDKLDVDPAVSSAVFVTTLTDVMGFFSASWA